MYKAQSCVSVPNLLEILENKTMDDRTGKFVCRDCLAKRESKNQYNYLEINMILTKEVIDDLQLPETSDTCMGKWTSSNFQNQKFLTLISNEIIKNMVTVIDYSNDIFIIMYRNLYL